MAVNGPARLSESPRGEILRCVLQNVASLRDTVREDAAWGLVRLLRADPGGCHDDGRSRARGARCARRKPGVRAIVAAFFPAVAIPSHLTPPPFPWAQSPTFRKLFHVQHLLLRSLDAGRLCRRTIHRPARLPLLRQGPAGDGQADGRPSALCRLLLAFLHLAGRRSLRWRDLPAALDAWRRSAGAGPPEGRCRLRDVPAAGRAVLHLPRRGRGAGRRVAAGIQRQSEGDHRHLRAEDGEPEGAPALGHRQSLLQPALHGRRGDQSRSGRLRLCGGAGEGGARRHSSPRRCELCLLGRARRLRDPAQHRHEARTRPARPVLRHARRLQAQDRLRGSDPDRAEAQGADQAPV